MEQLIHICHVFWASRHNEWGEVEARPKKEPPGLRNPRWHVISLKIGSNRSDKLMFTSDKQCDGDVPLFVIGSGMGRWSSWPYCLRLLWTRCIKRFDRFYYHSTPLVSSHQIGFTDMSVISHLPVQSVHVIRHAWKRKQINTNQWLIGLAAIPKRKLPYHINVFVCECA